MITIQFKKSDTFNNVDIRLKEISLEGWNGGNGNYKLNVTSSATDASEWTIPVSTSGIAKVQLENGLSIPDSYVILGNYMMIPQIINADALKLRIKFDILNVPYEITLTLNKGAQMTWATGNRYDYYISLSPDVITLDIAVSSSWTEQIGIPVVPEYVDLGLSEN
jgi:hypothetical protein